MVLHHPRRLGVGAAVASGLAHAQELGATAVVQIDGDGQHDAAFIPSCSPRWRWAPTWLSARGSSTDSRWAASVVAVLAVFARLMSYRLGTRLTDPTSGFRAFSPRAIEVLTPIFPLKYLSDTVEVLYLAADHGLRIATVPVSMNDRVGGKPSAGTVQSIGYALRMMGIVASHTFAHRHASADHRYSATMPTASTACQRPDR